MHIFVTVSRHALRHGAIRVVVVERTAHHAITFVKTHRGRAQGTTARGTLKARHGQTQGNHGAASSANNSGGHGKGSGHGKGKGKH